jgi:hypothetical protein
LLELKEGFDALADRRAGQRRLRTHTVKIKRAPTIAARELATVRKDMNLSRGLVAARFTLVFLVSGALTAET